MSLGGDNCTRRITVTVIFDSSDRRTWKRPRPEQTHDVTLTLMWKKPSLPVKVRLGPILRDESCLMGQGWGRGVGLSVPLSHELADLVFQAIP